MQVLNWVVVIWFKQMKLTIYFQMPWHSFLFLWHYRLGDKWPDRDNYRCSINIFVIRSLINCWGHTLSMFILSALKTKGFELKNWVETISSTLRCWLHETSALINTLSPGLEKNYTSEWSSNSFPGTTCMSGCRENCQKSIPKCWCPPI